MTAPRLMGGLDPDGNLKAIIVTPDGRLQSSGGGDVGDGGSSEIVQRLEEIRDASYEIRDAVNALRLPNTKTSPIQTSGSGDKTILVGGAGDNAGKQIRIHSLNFLASDVTTIKFKFGSSYVATGSMSLVSFSSDYTHPMIVPVDTNFIINVMGEVTLNGYVIWSC